MNKSIKYSVIVLLCLMLITTGCSLIDTKGRSPIDWITLANSGLSGRDNYAYSAHVETGVNDNIRMSMYNFTGQVHSHHEYSINSTEIDSTLLHPAKYMDIINKPDNKVSFVNESIDARADQLTIKLNIEEQSDKATLRWKSLLEQQFNQIKLSSNQIKIKQSKSVAQFITESEQELKEILDTLQVQSTYTLIIDAAHAIPISLHEHAVLQYERDNHPHSEYRLSKIQFNY